MRNLYFNKEVIRLFRHVDQFPCVRNFHFIACSPFGDYHDFDGHTELSIPLNMLPSLQHLTLESNTRFHVKEPDEPDEIVLEDEQRVAPRVVGDALPVLKTITIEMLDPSVIAAWLEDYLGQLKDHGKWDKTFELVIVGDGDADNCRDISRVGEMALKWCRSNQLLHV